MAGCVNRYDTLVLFQHGRLLQGFDAERLCHPGLAKAVILCHGRRMRIPIIAAAALTSLASAGVAAPVPVRVEPEQGGHGGHLMRDGQPYMVKGAGGTDRLEELAARGANSLRTWSTDGLNAVLDEAEKRNLTVSAGIWLESECGWFSYHKPEDCAKQTERVLREVEKFKDHPALLAWGLGNEAEGDGGNAAFWQQLDRLALKVREADPAHPTFTALAGMSPAKAKGLNEHAPHLDFVGINTYGAVFSLRKSLTEMGWTRPWMVTEWGALGFWERPKRPWGAALEQTSTEKAEMMDKACRTVLTEIRGGFLGSYAFVWGWKLEGSATWFGLITDKGETTAAADVLQRFWTGRAPANQAPAVSGLEGVPAEEIAPLTKFTAKAAASDADGDSLTWRWAVLPELENHDAGRPQPMPPAIPDTLSDAAAAGALTVTAPARPGHYRLYIWITDGHGHAATANMPFAIK